MHGLTVTTRFFGERWDTPYLDPQDYADGVTHEVVQTPVPVGEPCYWCDEPFAEGDRGLLRAVLREAGGTWEPIHAECELRQLMGSVNHLEGRCRCNGVEGTPYPGTGREEAHAVVAYVNALRARTGRGPLW
jgi:hypothetical protein